MYVLHVSLPSGGGGGSWFTCMVRGLRGEGGRANFFLQEEFVGSLKLT